MNGHKGPCCHAGVELATEMSSGETVYLTVPPKSTSYMHCKTPHEKNTVHQVTTMLATSKNVLFPGHNHLLIIGTDDLTL